LRTAIVDDSAADRERLTDYLCRWADENGIPLIPAPVCFDSGEALMSGFCPGAFDLIFLDVYMKGMNGMEAARRIREQDDLCRLFFTTYTPDFAVDSYEVSSSWYLLKPYGYEKLDAALKQCSMASLEQEQFLLVPGKNGREKLFLHQISWTEYENRKIRVHYLNEERQTLVSMNQREFSAMLLQYPYFCDCMKGILVNFEAVERLNDDSFLLSGGKTIPISRLKYGKVREQYLEYAYARLRE